MVGGEDLGKRLKRGRPYMWFGHRKGVRPSAHYVTKMQFLKNSFITMITILNFIFIICRTYSVQKLSKP